MAILILVLYFKWNYYSIVSKNQTTKPIDLAYLYMGTITKGSFFHLKPTANHLKPNGMVTPKLN